MRFLRLIFGEIGLWTRRGRGEAEEKVVTCKEVGYRLGFRFVEGGGVLIWLGLGSGSRTAKTSPIPGSEIAPACISIE